MPVAWSRVEPSYGHGDRSPIGLLVVAPFHPTPRGQEQLASLIEPVVDQLFAGG